MGKRPRISVLHVIYGLSAAGAESVVANYGRFLDKERFDMSVCALSTGGYYEKQLAEDGVRLFILRKRKGLDLSVIPQLFRLLRSQNIDIVHFHDISSSLYGTVPAALARVKVIVRTVHNVRIVGNDLLSRVKSTLVWFMLLFHHKIIAVSSEVEKRHSQSKPFLSAKYTTIHNGVDPSLFDGSVDRDKYLSEFGLTKRSVLIGIVGRFFPQKAHEIFLQAMQTVLKKRNDVGVLIVGDGPRKTELLNLSADLDLGDGVVFTGVRDDVPQILKLIDIFTLSSDWEGFPMTILEAMACGKPVVVTDVGGNREAVVHGETGFLVPARNPGALAEAILKLADDPKMRKDMGQRGRERFVKCFTVDVMARKTESVYDELLGRDSAGERVLKTVHRNR